MIEKYLNSILVSGFNAIVDIAVFSLLISSAFT